MNIYRVAVGATSAFRLFVGFMSAFFSANRVWWHHTAVPRPLAVFSICQSWIQFMYLSIFFTCSLLLFMFTYLSDYLLFWWLAKFSFFFFIDCDVGVFILVGLVLYFSRISTLSGESQILPAYIWVHIYIFFVSCQPTIWFIDSQGEAIFAEPNEYPVRVISAINVNLTEWWGHFISNHLGCGKFLFRIVIVVLTFETRPPRCSLNNLKTFWFAGLKFRFLQASLTM